MFANHARRRYTWCSPDSMTRNQIDYILVKRRFLKSVTSSRAYPGPDCGSDHNLVGANIKLHIRKDCKPNFREWHDLASLQDPAVESRYSIEVENRFEALEQVVEECRPDELWEKMKHVIKDTAGSVIGKRRKRVNKPWITEATLKLMDIRKCLKVNKTRSLTDMQEYRHANAAVQKQARLDKKQWLAEQCQQVELSLIHI